MNGIANGPVTITVHPTEEEFMQACHDLWASDGIGPSGNLILTTAFGLGGVGLALAGMGMGWFLVGAALTVVLMSLLRDRIWRCYYRSSGRFAAPTTSVFADAGIHVTGPLGTRDMPWSECRSYLESAEFLILVMSRRQFSVLPKAALHSADLDTLRALIACHLTVKRRRLI